jgi:prepilin-type N-terminal cleavage/methylation domain-containing protein
MSLNGMKRALQLRAAPRGARGFTLIELLMVMGIVGLIMAVAIPFFNGIGQGTKLDSATTELRFAIMQARQFAITRRERVYIVFPINDGAFAAQGLSNIAYRAYAVCTTNAFIREWAFLPQGLFFDRNFPAAASANNVFTQNTYLKNAPGLWSISQPCLAFRTDGSLETRNNHPEVAIGEGHWLNRPAGFPTITSTNTLNSIQIYGFTGMPQVNRK